MCEGMLLNQPPASPPTSYPNHVQDALSTSLVDQQIAVSTYTTRSQHFCYHLCYHTHVACSGLEQPSAHTTHKPHSNQALHTHIPTTLKVGHVGCPHTRHAVEQALQVPRSHHVVPRLQHRGPLMEGHLQHCVATVLQSPAAGLCLCGGAVRRVARTQRGGEHLFGRGEGRGRW